ncbi:MAG: alpha/beta fold hydrolase [Syntrophobacteraceae bacterium]
MAEPVMIRSKGDGIEIQLALWEGKGKTLLCIHGLTANCRCWDVIAEALAPDHRLLGPDLRGRGLSDKPSAGYSVDHHCRDILKIFNYLKLEQVVLLGHSLGAVISLAFAAHFPDLVERLILVDGGGKLSKAQTARVLAGIKPALDRPGRVYRSFEAYIRTMQFSPFFQPWSAATETYFRYEVEEIDGGVRSRIQPEHIQEELLNIVKFDTVGLYPKITCPTLILRATEGMLSSDDILLPTRTVNRMLRDIRQSQCVDIKGANHYSIVFQPNETRDEAIRRFLGQQLSQRA